MQKKHNRKTLLFKVIITLWILTTKQKNTHKKKTAEQTSAIKCVFRVKVISIFFSNTSHTLIHTQHQTHT